MNRMTLCGSLLIPIILTTIAAAAERADFTYPPTVSLDEVRGWVERASTDHPRLFATGDDFTALRKSLSADPLRRQLADAVIREADLLQDVAPIERKLQGRRLLGQSRRCVKRTVTLAMAYHLTGDTKHVRRCEKEMLAVARFEDFNPSHFLDTAEMTFALAIGYDWLHDQLDEDARKTIRTAIVEKGCNLPYEMSRKWWFRATNNWGQVCHAGLTAGALAVMEHEPDLAAKTVHNAVHNVTNAMDVYAPAGSYPEGPGYWNYGTGYNVVLIDLLESVLGSDFGLTKAPGFSKTGQYVSLACGPSGEFFNYADGHAGRGAQPVMYWFASRYDRPDWLMGERDRLRETIAQVTADEAASGSNRLLPLTLLWMQPSKNAPSEIRMPLNWQSGGETPVAFHRSSWTDPAATFVGLKAGSPSANHGHMDVGSFVLDADGVRWAVDLGSESYYRIESRGMNLWSRSQKGDRWTIFRLSSLSHNTLVIDNQLQRADGHGEMIGFSDDEDFPHSIVDMTSAYQGQAQTVHRGVAMVGREVLIQDELTGLKPGSRVRWGMVTPGTPDSLGKETVELRQKDARLTLKILSPQTVQWQQIDTATPRNEWDSPNQGTRMLAFEAVAPESGRLTLAVLATPGTVKDSADGDLEVKTLDDWGR